MSDTRQRGAYCPVQTSSSDEIGRDEHHFPEPKVGFAGNRRDRLMLWCILSWLLTILVLGVYVYERATGPTENYELGWETDFGNMLLYLRLGCGRTEG